mgnify:CR=1 FL=1
MICENLEGTLDELNVSDRTVEYVEMGDWVLKRGLQEGDVIYQDDSLVIAVHTPPCEIIQIKIQAGHKKAAAKVCYEIGNRHAPLFYGKDEDSFVTPYNEPMLEMLQKFHGVLVEKTVGVRS